MSKFRRQLMMASMGDPVPPLPYDAEVEWLKSDGSAYINTGISYDTNDTIKITTDGSFSSLSEQNQFMGIYGGAFFGVSTSNYFCVGSASNNVVPADINNHTFIFTSTIGNSKANVLSIDGTSYSYSRNNSTGTAYLFNLNNGSYPCKFRMKMAQIEKNNVRLLDLIPVRVGTTGYMYDKVSGELFGNDGTGSFLFGPDKNDIPYDAEVEYLKGDGNAFIDTGVNGSSKVRIECSMYNESSAEGIVFGEIQRLSASVSSTRCMMQLLSGDSETYMFYQNTNTTPVTFNKVLNQWVELVGNWKTGTFKVGTTTKTGTVVQYEDNCSIYLFARHRNVYSGGGTYDNVCGGLKIRTFTMYVDDVIVHDFIPVRVGHVGKMYDCVTHQLFGNINTTGAFVYGNDKN